jgi:hypothetical protein
VHAGRSGCSALLLAAWQHLHCLWRPLLRAMLPNALTPSVMDGLHRRHPPVYVLHPQAGQCQKNLGSMLASVHINQSLITPNHSF